MLTAALNDAGTLRWQAAYLLSRLLDQRADVYDQLRQPEKASADRQAAEKMLSLPVPTMASAA